MKNIVRLVVSAALLALSPLCGRASSSILEAVAVPTRGLWCSDLDATLAAGESAGEPVVVFFASVGCGHCADMQRAVNTQEFQSWAGENPCFMAFGTSNRFKEFAREGVRTLVNFPYICVYLPYVDNGRKENFSGLNGQMYAGRAGDSLQRQLIDSLEAIFANYPPYVGGEFVVGETVGDRLEAEIGYTSRIVVPLRRAASCAASSGFNWIYAKFPGGATQVRTLEWAPGQTDGSVEFSVDTTAKVAPGDQIKLIAQDENVVVDRTSSVTFVSRANSPKNPAWIGTRTADALRWGEWTMDLDVAKEKVAAFNRDNPGDRAYTLALVAGGLWCPDCARNDAYVIDTPEFRAWTEKNNVACVCIDIPSDPSVGGPCLLSREVREVSAKYVAADPEGGAFQSGAGYLSRWMIDDEVAAEVMKRNAALVGVSTLDGGWNRPERTNKTRTGVPIFVLLREDGEIAGRIETFATTSPDDASRIAGNIRRLDELLATIDDDGGESDFHPLTTIREVSADGGLARMDLSGADQADTVRVTDTVDYARLRVTAEGTTSDGLSNELSVYLRTNGVVTLVKSVSGFLSAGPLSLEVDLMVEGGEYFARLGLEGLGDLALFGRDADMFSVATVACELEYPAGDISFGDAVQTVFVPDGVAHVMLRRGNGRFGAISARVTVDPGTAAGFFDFDGAVVEWEAGDVSDKMFEIPVFRADGLASGSFELGLTDVVGAGIGEIDRHAVVLTDTDEPCFGVFDNDVEAWSLFAAERRFELRNVAAKGSVSLKKISGSLPKGLRISYDRKSGDVVLAGTPTSAPGVYTVSYAVKQNGVTGLPATFTIVVGDPVALNPYLSKKRPNQDIPLFAQINATNAVVAGMLTVAVTAKNKITAKFKGAETKSATFSGSWRDVLEDGSTFAELKDKKGNSLALRMDAEGAMSAELFLAMPLVDLAAGVDRLAVDSVPWPTTDYLAWAGYYTVTLVDREGVAGTGYLTLTVRANGSVKWAGVLANGVSVSGTSNLRGAYMDEEGDRVANVGIFKCQSKDVFGFDFAIKANSSLWFDTDYAQMIHNAPGVAAYQLHRETGLGYLFLQNAYGGWYEQNISPRELCVVESFGYDPDAIVLSFGVDRLVASEVYGAPDPIEDVILSADDKTISPVGSSKGVKFTFKKKTGLFNGSATVTFTNGKSVKGTFKGVLLPGWTGCSVCGEARELVERPFGSGAFWFKENVNGRSIVRSLPVDLRVTTRNAE